MTPSVFLPFFAYKRLIIKPIIKHLWVYQQFPLWDFRANKFARY
jgi:hypothetical protein